MISPYAFAGIPQKEKKETSKLDITISVCKASGLLFDQIFEHTKKYPIVLARNICIYIMRKKGFTTGDVARYFRMHHTNISTAVKSIQDRLDTNDILIAPYYYILNELKIKAK